MSRTETSEPAPAGGVLALLRRSRVLQVLLVVVIAANLAVGGMAGTLGAARTGGLRSPVVTFGARDDAGPQVTSQAAEGSRK